MDAVQFPIAAPPAASTPFARADAAVGTAEVAGVVPRTAEIPLPFPATFGQTGEVNKSRIGGAVVGAETDIAPERVMKPWGLPMLPDLAKEDAAQDEADAEREAKPESVEATMPQTEAKDAPDAEPVEQVSEPSMTAAPEDPAQPQTDPFADAEELT